MKLIEKAKNYFMSNELRINTIVISIPKTSKDIDKYIGICQEAKNDLESVNVLKEREKYVNKKSRDKFNLKMYRKAKEKVKKELENVRFNSFIAENDDEYIFVVYPFIISSNEKLNVGTIAYWDRLISKKSKRNFKKDFRDVKGVKIEIRDIRNINLDDYKVIY